LESAGKVHENNQKDTNQVRRSTSDAENEKMDTYGQQVQQQRIQILCNAFDNPIENLLEYEPWAENNIYD